MNPAWFEPFLSFCGILLEKPITLESMQELSSSELLQLADSLSDEHIPLLMMVLKSFGPETGIFEKLMGEHEEENRVLVDRFFERYSEQVMADLHTEDLNPLSLYLSEDSLHDLVFLESRKEFFLRQNIDTIQSYLNETFTKSPVFLVGEQEQAWNWFWEQALQK